MPALGVPSYQSPFAIQCHRGIPAHSLGHASVPFCRFSGTHLGHQTDSTGVQSRFPTATGLEAVLGRDLGPHFPLALDLPPSCDSVPSAVQWLSSLSPFSRAIRNIGEDFDDGTLVAELICRRLPKVLPESDLSSLHWGAGSRDLKRSNWEMLNVGALKQLGIQLSSEFVDAVISHESFPAPVETSVFDASQKTELTQRYDRSLSNEGGRVSAILRLLDLLHSALDCFTGYYAHLQALPMIKPGEDTSCMKLHRFPGTRLVRRPLQSTTSNKTVVRLTNVDYTTRKRDVLTFLWPIVIFPEDVHIPIHLSTGKMTYEIYIELSGEAMSRCVVEMCSGHSLLSRRVEAQMVRLEELLVVIYGRTHKFIDETTVFLTQEQKERMWKLCWNAKNTFNGKTPSRPFEHILSYIKLLPWDDACLSDDQRTQAFTLLKVAMKTLIQYDDQKHAFAPSLVTEMLQVVHDYVSFTPEQVRSLELCAQRPDMGESRSKSTSAAVPNHRRHSHDGVFRKFELIVQAEEGQSEHLVDALGRSLWNALSETRGSRPDSAISCPARPQIQHHAKPAAVHAVSFRRKRCGESFQGRVCDQGR